MRIEESAQARLLRCLVALVALAGGVAVLYGTRHGAGISPDSIAYIGAARNLLHGYSFSLPYGQLHPTPLTQFPPLYPLVLAGGGLLGLEPFSGARWVNAFVFGLGIFLVGNVVLRHTAAGSWVAVGGALLMLTSPVLLTIALMAWTEPLFLLCGFASLWLLAKFMAQPNRYGLYASAVLVGLAALTRYTGVALVITGCLGLLLFGRGTLWRRMADALRFALIGLLPLALWMVRNTVVAGTTTNRELSAHLLGRAQIVQALVTVSRWMAVPATAPGIIKLVAGLLLLVLIVYALYLPLTRQEHARMGATDAATYFVKLLAMSVITYGGFLALSLSFIDANTPLDDRILSPVYVAVLILGLFIAGRALAGVWQSHLVPFASLLVGILLFGFYLSQGIHLLASSHKEGIGFEATRWQESPIISQVRILPADTLIISNAPNVIYFLTGRRSMAIPKQTSAMSQQKNARYGAELETVKEMVGSEQAVVVYVNNLSRSSAAEERELQAYLDLHVVSQTADGAIYRRALDGQTALD